MLAVTVKENVNPEVSLEDPKAVIKEPLLRPETPRIGEDDQVIAEREARDKVLREDKVILENEERYAPGPKVGHTVFYHEVEKRLTSRLFLALGTEEKNRFVQKYPYTEISKLEFSEIFLSLFLTGTTRSYTYIFKF